jgi:hypothetical protein
VSALRWEQENTRALFGYSGEVVVGMVVTRADGVISWSAHEAVSMRWIAKGQGESVSVEAAKRAVGRAWKIWLDKAALGPRK